MGTTVRLLAPAGAPLEAVRDGIEQLAARLTRFDPASELCVLNADPRTVVPASPLLRHAVAAALLGARRTGGLADPTLLGALEDAGYATSRVGVEPASLHDALRAAPPRRPAGPGAPLARGPRRPRGRHDRAPARRPARPRRQRQGTRRRLGRTQARGVLRGRLRRRRAARRRARRPGARHRRDAPRHDGAVATSGLDRRVWHVRRQLRPPPPRPVDRRARVDRPDRRHRPRADRARGRGAGQGRPAVRPGAGASGS